MHAETPTITEQPARLAANENPFGASPVALRAAQAALADAGRYPAQTDADLRAALAAHWGRGITPDHLFSANGGVEVLSLIEDAMIRPGERAVICPPCFGPYGASLGAKGVAVDPVPLKGADYTVDVAGIHAAITDETRLVYLCNPNNPTGTWFGQDVLNAVLDGLPENVTVIYDSVYWHFATHDPVPDACVEIVAGRNVVAVHSFSKGYGLAGMRIGYGMARPDLIDRIARRKRSFHLNGAALAGAKAALTDTGHLARTVANNTAERARLTRALTTLGLRVTPSQGNFVMFACPGPDDARTLCDRLARHQVQVRPAFDLPHHIRATVGLPAENDRLIAALSEARP